MQTIEWSSQSTSHPRYGKGVSANIKALLAYFKAQGWVNLGNFGVRPVRGGTKPSAHAFGSAQDLGYGEHSRDDVVALIDFIIANHDVLGVQEIHDYAGLRLWRLDRVGGKGGAGPDGWKPQAKGSHGGGMNPGSRWIHIETSLSDFDLATPIAERLAGSPATPPPVQPENVNGYYFEQLPVLRKGSKSLHVAMLQQILVKANQDIGKVDGDFGARTEAGVKNVQMWLGGPTFKADGIVGPLTWQLMAKVAPEAFGL